MRVALPNGQMYHVHVDNRVPYWIYSNRQDDGTMRGPTTRSEQTGNGCLPEDSTMPQRRRRRPRPWARSAAAAAARPDAALSRADARLERRPLRRRRQPWRGRDAGHGVAAEHRRLRIGLHDSRSDRREHRLRVAATATR